MADPHFLMSKIILSYFHSTTYEAKKILHKFDAIISEETLHAMLDSCPALEILLMKYNEGFRCVRINSRSLKSTGVHTNSFRQGPTLKELIIEDAPFL